MTFKTTFVTAAFAGALLAGALQAQARDFRSADVQPPDYPTVKAVQFMSDELKAESNGKYAIKVFPSSQLGSQKDVTEQLTIGSNVITISDGGFLMDYVPAFGVTYLPYIFDNKEQLFKILSTL